MRNNLIILFSILLFSLTISTNGQKLLNSPFSRFNIGSMEPSGSFKSQGMGGLSVALRSNNSIYFSNPASYSSLDTNSFVFDFGLDYTMARLTDGTSNYSSQDGNFDHLLMGFPLARGWGLAMGIGPYSNGYYKLEETITENDPEYDPLVGSYSSLHSGSGGLTSVFVGSGINLTKNFSAGVNMTLIFGQINRINQFDFADYYNVYHNNTTENLEISGLNLDYGIQYSGTLKNDHFINAGLSFTAGKYYNTNYEHLLFRYTAYSTQDTISVDAVNSKSTFLPASLRLGISFGKKDNYTAGLDYITTNWSSAKIPGASGYSADSRSLIFGAEYIPEKYSNYSFIRRLEYRIGGHIGDNYLIINGEQIKEIGASVGLGVPMRRTFSTTNIFFDYTRKSGSTINGLHTEDFYTVGLSLNLYDVWFIKRKYN